MGYNFIPLYRVQELISCVIPSRDTWAFKNNYPSRYTNYMCAGGKVEPAWTYLQTKSYQLNMSLVQHQKYLYMATNGT